MGGLIQCAEGGGISAEELWCLEEVAEDQDVGRVLQARRGKVLAVVFAVLVSVGVPSALLVVNSVGQVLGDCLAGNAVVGVHGVRVADQVVHVAHVGAGVIVRVALGDRADVRGAARSVGGE